MAHSFTKHCLYAAHAFYMVLLGIVAFAPAVTGQSGAVDGRVIGPSGNAIGGARVYALATQSANPGRHVEVLTDSQGGFTLKSLRPGAYELHAYAPDFGYPDNLFAVFQTAPVPTIDVKDNAAIHGVVIRLGPTPGTLSGEIVDGRDGKPLPQASLTISWADRPEYYIRSSVNEEGHFTFNVPLHPLLISVACEGYHPWKSEAITVPSGGKHNLSVTMIHE